MFDELLPQMIVERNEEQRRTNARNRKEIFQVKEGKDCQNKFVRKLGD